MPQIKSAIFLIILGESLVAAAAVLRSAALLIAALPPLISSLIMIACETIFYTGG